MLLHCGMDEGAELEQPAPGAQWLRRETRESLLELNEQCLELFAEQAAMRTSQGSLMLRQIGELWRTLDAGARRRAAACPYLLVDAGFNDPLRWRWTGTPQVRDCGRTVFAAFFTVPRTTKLARLVFTYAWYLARTEAAGARLLLGMPPPCATLIGARTLRQIQDLAEERPEWLRPRWPGRVKVWRELLLAAASGNAMSLESARMHGLQLLAGEARAAESR